MTRIRVQDCLSGIRTRFKARILEENWLYTEWCGKEELELFAYLVPAALINFFEARCSDLENGIFPLPAGEGRSQYSVVQFSLIQRLDKAKHTGAGYYCWQMARLM